MTYVAGSETDRGRSIDLDQAGRSGEPTAPAAFDLYLIRTRSRGAVLFVTRRSLAAYAASEKDRFLRFVRRLMRSRNRVIRWVGRVSRMGHRYYQRLEDRIDPLERMVKALNHPGILNVWHSPGFDAREEFRDFLRWQATKHMTWIGVDGVVTAVAIVLAPFTVPIPGPNVLFFFPFLRLLSHVQALRGARRGLADSGIRFRELDDLRWAGQGEGLRDKQDSPDADGEVVEGLNDFLERLG